MIFNQARPCSGNPCRKIEVFAKNRCYLNNSSVYWLLMHLCTMLLVEVTLIQHCFWNLHTSQCSENVLGFTAEPGVYSFYSRIYSSIALLNLDDREKRKIFSKLDLPYLTFTLLT
jgi:hypothetical protein